MTFDLDPAIVGLALETAVWDFLRCGRRCGLAIQLSI